MAEPHNPPDKICPQCGALSPNSEDFCHKCGTKLPFVAVCQACGENIIPGEQFCNSCGTPVSPPPTPFPVMNAPPSPPPPVMPPNVPVTGRQPGVGTPVSGKGPRKFLVPVIIAVVIIGVIATIVLVGIPGTTIPGTTNPGTPAISHAFDGDWLVENTANSGTVELFRISILPDHTVAFSVPGSPNINISGTLSDEGKTIKGTLTDSAAGTTGPFTLTLSDNNHFSGTWLVRGHNYAITGQIQ